MKDGIDKFEISKKNPFVSRKKNENFFIMKDSTALSNEFNLPTRESYRRLNDYDSNILQQDAYKNVSDELFKLEYKISQIEEELKTIESQIQAARDICDYDLVGTLQNKKLLIEEVYSELINSYNKKSLSTRMTESLSCVFGSCLKTRLKSLLQNFGFITDSILQRLPKPFTASIELKKSLNKLENINRSVDELININNSHYDGFNKYEQLSKYIIKANNIQSNIKKFIKE